MAEPTDGLPVWDSNEDNVEAIGSARETGGWQQDVNSVFERPPVGVFNKWMNLVYQWVLHFRNKTRDTIADLRLLSVTNLSTDDTVVVNGYYAVGDGGGGPRRYLDKGKSVGYYTDNGGSIIVPTGGDGSAAWLCDPLIMNVVEFGAINIRGTALTTDSTGAFLALKAVNPHVYAPDGVYILSSTYEILQGCSLRGDGVDYWDTYRPTPSRLLKSIEKGTHLIFTGTGAKSHSIINLMNARDSKTVGADTYDFTHFTNEDSSTGVSATAKSFSAAVIMHEDSRLENIRVVPNFDIIDGYNDDTTLLLGDEWDVGVWAQSANESLVENVQSVGYWRIAGILITENDGTYTQVGNPERFRVNRVFSTGIRGLLIRNGAQIDVVSNTTTQVVLKYNDTFTLTSQNQFTVPGSSSVFTFTGYSVAASEITLTGVTPNMPLLLGTIRQPNAGNNMAGTVFNDCVFDSFEHTDGSASDDLGLPISGAFEIDGYPLRSIKFVNTKFQTVHDKLNSLFGDCRDLKFVGCEMENGVKIAYTNTETGGYTENLRLTNTDIDGGTSDLTAFTPREMFDDYRMFPTEFGNTSLTMKPVVDSDLILTDFGDNDILRYRTGSTLTELNGDAIELSQLDGTLVLQSFVTGNMLAHFNFTVNLKITSNNLTLLNLSTYADDAAAGAGGLTTGEVYKTATGELMIKL